MTPDMTLCRDWPISTALRAWAVIPGMLTLDHTRTWRHGHQYMHVCAAGGGTYEEHTQTGKDRYSVQQWLAD